MILDKRIRGLVSAPPLVVLLILVLLVGTSLYRSSVFQVCIDTQTYEKSDQGSEHPQNPYYVPDYLECAAMAADDGRDLIVAFGTLVIAWFTGTLWWSTHKLWKSSERQIEIAEKSANAALLSARIAQAGLTARHRADPQPTFDLDIAGDIVVGVRNLGQHRAAISTAAADIITSISGEFSVTSTTPAEIHTAIRDGDGCIIFIIGNSPTFDTNFCRGFFRWEDGVGKWERRFCVQVRITPKQGELHFTTVGGSTWNHVVESS